MKKLITILLFITSSAMAQTDSINFYKLFPKATECYTLPNVTYPERSEAVHHKAVISEPHLYMSDAFILSHPIEFKDALVLVNDLIIAKKLKDGNTYFVVSYCGKVKMMAVSRSNEVNSIDFVELKDIKKQSTIWYEFL